MEDKRDKIVIFVNHTPLVDKHIVNTPIKA